MTTKVKVIETDERGPCSSNPDPPYIEWAIEDVDDPDFWHGAFSTRQEAGEFCQNNRLNIQPDRS